MKVLLVYESMFGNSERVARAIADGLAEHVEVVVRDVTTGVPGDIPPDTDLLVAGGPTHAMSMTHETTREDAIRQGARQGLASRGLREWLEAVPPLHGLAFTTFDTRVTRARRFPGSAAKAAARVLRRRGGRQAAGPVSFYVDDVSGPLGDDQLERARSWGATLGLDSGRPVTSS